MHQVIYTSAATVPFSEPELEELLRKARENNSRADVSGLLIYHRGSFLQVLEGPRLAVETIYTAISRDPRHGRLSVIRRLEVGKRSFADWSMGFANTAGQDRDGLPGYLDYLTDIHVTPDRVDADMAWWAISEFRRGNLRQFVRTGPATIAPSPIRPPRLSAWS